MVDSGIGLSYRLAKLHRLAGRYDNPMPKPTISLQSGTKNLATVHIASWAVDFGVKSVVLYFIQQGKLYFKKHLNIILRYKQ